MKILTWLNGKKTTIGAMCMVASLLIKEVLVGIWGVDGAWVHPAMDTLEYFGGSLATIGLGHKFIKVKQQ